MPDAGSRGMTDSLPRSQQRPPDGDEADDPGWGGPPPPDPAGRGTETDETAADQHPEQPGLPEEPISPAEGGD